MNIILTKSLARSIEQAEIDTMASRLEGIGSIHSNPMGIEVRKFGHATAFSAQKIPGPSFNTVKGITDKDSNQIESILNFYKQKNIPVQFELTPAHVSSNLMHQLAKKGFYQSDFHTTLYSEPFMRNEQTEASISIRRLRKSEFDVYAHIYAEGFNMPAFLQNGIAQNNEVLFGSKHWTFYLASVEGQPAGIGVVFIKNKIANLAAAATLPSMRNKGVHRALIMARIQQALATDCDLIVAQAKFGSVSLNNMERLGMLIAYTKAIWVQ